MPSRAALLALVALGCGLFACVPDAGAATQHAAAKKKHCKKTQVLRGGKCVAKPNSPGQGSPAQPAPDPKSDADGDGLPYGWEAAPAATPAPAKPVKKRKKCKKGQVRKHGKCVKKKSQPSHKRGGVARASAAEPTNLAQYGASPEHKDIFVEIDYASDALKQNAAGACGELDALVAAFASAPVSNPDGTTGINLHIDAGVRCPSRSYDLGGSKVFSAGECPSTSATFNGDQLAENRVGAFHLASFSPLCGGGGGEGGAAALHGVSMVIFTEGSSFAHVLMHELGHNLGLDHPNGYQPNRISSMNTRLEVSDTGSSATETLDYQRFDLPALDEEHLSEEAGIDAPAAAHRYFVMHYCAGESSFRYAWPGDGPIDWNCNSPALQLPGEQPTIDPGTVSADVNGDGQLTVLPATHDEWSTLDYASGGKIGPR